MSSDAILHQSSAAIGAATGPVMIGLLGYNVPVLAALTSVAGVILASFLAPPPPNYSTVKRIALGLLLCVLMVALVLADPQRSLLVTTCWAIGIGYSGLPVIEAIHRAVVSRSNDLLGTGAAITGGAIGGASATPDWSVDALPEPALPPTAISDTAEDATDVR